MKIAAYVLAAVGAAAVLLLLLWSQQRRLLYFPEPDPGLPPAGWVEVTFQTESGLALAGWHREAQRGNAAAIVVVFPGNGGNRAGRVPLGDALSRRGFEVLLVDYRGYGGNPGSPSEHGLADDALSAARFATGLRPGLPVVYLGESLGAAVAIGVAVEEPPDALILGSPFTSLADVGTFHYAWAPRFLFRETYPSLDRFESGALDGVPVLVVAGTADSVVPVAQSKAIADAAGAEWYVVEGAEHNDPPIRYSAPFADRIAAFIEQAVGG